MISVVYLRECYKHKWLLDFVNQQMDKLSYRVTNTSKLENRIYNYIGQYLLRNEGNYKNRAFIKSLVMKKIKESLPRYGGLGEENLNGSFDDEEKCANLNACYNKQLEKRTDINFWIEALARDNPKHVTIVQSISNGLSVMETAKILTDKFGGKIEGNRTCINRFRKECRLNKKEILKTLFI